MRRIQTYILLLLLAIAPLASAKDTHIPTLPIEREQQFTYYWYAAMQCLNKQEYPEAMMHLRLCEAINPQDATTKDYIGRLYSAIQQTELARTYFEQAYTLHPETGWHSYALWLLQACYNDQDNNDLRRDFLRITTHATHLLPKDPTVWDLHRQATVLNHKYRQAIQAQDHLDALQGYDAMSAINRYRIYALDGKYRKALQAINDYLILNPTDLRFLLFKADLLSLLQADPEEQIQTYRAILCLDPNNLLILNNYAYLLATHGGDLNEAERMSQKTIQAQPENPVFLDTYAWILHLQGQHSLALFYITKALQNATETEKEEIQSHYNTIQQNPKK